MRWLELSVDADVEAVEAVSEILGRVAAGTIVQPARLVRDPDDELAVREDPSAGYAVVAHIADDGAAVAAIEATERALWHLQAFGLRPMSALRVRPVADSDWEEAWKEHYVPQRIGRVVVIPSWSSEALSPGDVAITLDPGMAFGTGLHPTTQGCLRLLQEIDPMPSPVLDVGIGSGILALAALRLGAERAIGLDTDPLAVEAAMANAARNGLADRLAANVGTLPEIPTASYPLVLANLVAVVLIDLAPRLAGHLAPSGQMLASGIIQPKADAVIAALAAAGLEVVTRHDDGEWVSLRLERAA
ncbi:MAG TPA: 50S ribosomal protein L11 methyltransferase [Candidatus Limnocylindria bacterium]|nr:50S ribosomal protein L11 methyltransferase [Candidatus Limnocylindria bacterium]